MRLVALFLICLSTLSAPQASAQGSDLRRLSLRSDHLGWEAVGRLDIGRSGFCTGALVSSHLVLTAAHCLFDPETGDRVDPRAVTFRAGLRDGDAVAQRRVRRAVVHKGYDYRSSDATGRIRHDLALVELESPITVRDADPFRTDSLSGGAATRVSVVSYARGRSEALSRQSICRIVGRGNGLVGLDCDVSFGSSGAPVFQERDGRMRIVSVISSVTTTRDGTMSVGMELPQLLVDLKAALRSGRGVWPKGETSTRRMTVGAERPGGGARFVRP